MGIKAIPSKMFKNCASLKTIVIPNSVKEIGSAAFMGCHSMTEVDIPSSVAEIGGDAFNECHGLTKVVLRAGRPAKIKKDTFSKAMQKEGVFYVPNTFVYQSDPKSVWIKFRNYKLINL